MDIPSLQSALELSGFSNKHCSIFDYLRSEIKKIFEDPHKIKKNKKNLRVYADGGENPEYYQDFLNFLEPKNQNLEDFFSKNEEDGKEVFVVLNHAEHYSEEIAKFVTDIFSPMIKEKNWQTGSLEAAVFMGKTGYTPFGAHFDKDQENVFHFHLGPNNKDFYLWYPDVFKKETGSSDSYFDIDRIKHTGLNDLVTCNSLYHLRPQLYHVAYYHGFSISLAVACVKLTERQLIGRCLKKLGDSFTSDFKEIHCLDLEPAIDGMFERNKKINTSFEKILKKHTFDYRMSLQSNGFLDSEPVPENETRNIGNETRLRKLDAFPILFSRSEDEFLIYARKNILTIAYNEKIQTALHAISSGNDFTLEALSKQLGTEEMEIVKKMVSIFVRVRAVQIMEM